MRRAAPCVLRIIVLVVLSLSWGGPTAWIEAQELERRPLWVTSPWLALMCRFVGGVYVDIQPLSFWEEGRLVMPKTTLPEGAIVIALDAREVRRFGFKTDGVEVRTLYGSLPLEEAERERLFLDPAGLPFLGQRLLIVLAAIDKERYSYYQRRLAEFQSRLESTVDVGRQVIGDALILDLTGRSSLLIEGAVKTPIRPPQAVWEKWEKGEGYSSLRLSLQEARRRDWFVVTDVWTPESVLMEAQASGPVVQLPGPNIDEDLFLYLYDQYLEIWNAVRQRESGRRP